MVTWRSNKPFKEAKEDDTENSLGHCFGERNVNTKADGKSYDIYVYTSPERTPFVRRLFRQILSINICCYFFSVPLYILVFPSLFSILLFNRLLTILRWFYFTVSVNIANTNFSRMTILDYVACFFIFSLFYISPWYFVSKIRSYDL